VVVEHVEVGPHKRDPVEAAVDVKGATDQPRAGAPVDSRTRLERAYQNRLRLTFSPSHEVQAVVHAIREVDVGVARRSEHHLRARRAPAAGGMGSQVVRPQVGLDLDQPAPPLLAVDLADEDLAQQVTGDGHRIAREEIRREKVAFDQSAEVGAGAATTFLRIAWRRRLST